MQEKESLDKDPLIVEENKINHLNNLDSKELDSNNILFNNLQNNSLSINKMAEQESVMNTNLLEIEKLNIKIKELDIKQDKQDKELKRTRSEIIGYKNTLNSYISISNQKNKIIDQLKNEINEYIEEGSPGKYRLREKYLKNLNSLRYIIFTGLMCFFIFSISFLFGQFIEELNSIYNNTHILNLQTWVTFSIIGLEILLYIISIIVSLRNNTYINNKIRLVSILIGLTILGLSSGILLISVGLKVSFFMNLTFISLITILIGILFISELNKKIMEEPISLEQPEQPEQIQSSSIFNQLSIYIKTNTNKICIFIMIIFLSLSFILIPILSGVKPEILLIN